jgi:hypothetical protein
MTYQGKLLPKDVVAHWPEVFGDVKLNIVPLGYLHTVLVKFKDGKIWEIRITTRTKKGGWKSFENSLSELYKTYEDSIEELDFKLDTDRVKKDIEKLTERFLKRIKL